MATILVVDDDRNVCRVLKGLLEEADFHVLAAHDVDTALKVSGERDLDLVVTDLKMPGKSGMDMLRLSRERKPAMPVIMISAFGNVEEAVAAMKRGAYDFITKPFDENELLNVIRKALSESEKNRELISAYFDTESSFSAEIIGWTPAVRRILQTVKKIAPTDSTVLIRGETGVGKELIARAVHLASRRRGGSFVKVNCAAIPEALLESELFGYEKGAFTGAVTDKPGRFEIADKGTIFLDEIGEMPLHLQTKILNVLQDRAFERVGGVKTIKVDIRIIAATNRDLHSDAQSGKFRPDLFYRLNVVPIHIPPLRDRKDDLVPLVEYLLRKLSARHERPVSRIEPEAMAALTQYDWPGNIRELENVLERMVLLSGDETLGPGDVPEEMRGAWQSSSAATLKEKVGSVTRNVEEQMILDALDKTDQNRTNAAKMLGISRRTLQKKIKEYGL